MTSFVRELVTVDRHQLNLRAGVLGLIVLAVMAAAIAWVGPAALAAVIGALVVLSAEPPPAGRSWAVALPVCANQCTEVVATALQRGRTEPHRLSRYGSEPNQPLSLHEAPGHLPGYVEDGTRPCEGPRQLTRLVQRCQRHRDEFEAFGHLPEHHRKTREYLDQCRGLLRFLGL